MLHLTKLVQRNLEKSCRPGDIGSYTLPQGMSLPLTTQRAVTDVERLLLDDNTCSQLMIEMQQQMLHCYIVYFSTLGVASVL